MTYLSTDDPEEGNELDEDIPILFLVITQNSKGRTIRAKIMSDYEMKGSQLTLAEILAHANPDGELVNKEVAIFRRDGSSVYYMRLP